MAQLINSLETKIGYTFRNPHLCHEALTTAGVPFQGSIAHGHLDGNSSLAFIGDSVLQLGVGRRSRELHETKGQRSNRMNRVANNHNLANVFDTANLSPHVIGNPSQQGVISPKTKATLVEALLGAVSEDGGIEAALEVMHTLEIE